MSTTTSAPAWWRTVPNPPCRPWCAEDHDPAEFNAGGGMLCVKVIRRDGSAASFSVEVQQMTGTEENDVPHAYALSDVTIFTHTDFNTDAADAGTIERYAVALQEAVRFVREVTT